MGRDTVRSILYLEELKTPMTFQLPPIAEIEHSFEITEILGIELPGLEKSPITGTFRQANEGDNTKRDDFNNVPIRNNYNNNGKFASQESTPRAWGERRAYEVWLTLCSLDLNLSDGKPLCTFSNSGIAPRVKESFGQFKDRWGQMPSSLARAIHDECMITNPDWAPRLFDDEVGE